MKITVNDAIKNPEVTSESITLFAPTRKVLRVQDWTTIDTGVHVEIPKGHIGMLAPIESLMSTEGITCRGVITSDATEPIMAVLYNHSNKTHIIEAGEPIAKMYIVPILAPM